MFLQNSDVTAIVQLHIAHVFTNLELVFVSLYVCSVLEVGGEYFTTHCTLVFLYLGMLSLVTEYTLLGNKVESTLYKTVETSNQYLRRLNSVVLQIKVLRLFLDQIQMSF